MGRGRDTRAGKYEFLIRQYGRSIAESGEGDKHMNGSTGKELITGHAI
jgi:hypothetical protein